MTTRNDGGPAFPQLDVVSGERDGHGDLIEPFTSAAGGMSLRDWFAGTAPSPDLAPPSREALAGPKPQYADFATEGEWLIASMRWEAEAEAAWRYTMADALLAAREKEGR